MHLLYLFSFPLLANQKYDLCLILYPWSLKTNKIAEILPPSNNYHKALMNTFFVSLWTHIQHIYHLILKRIYVPLKNTAFFSRFLKLYPFSVKFWLVNCFFFSPFDYKRVLKNIDLTYFCGCVTFYYTHM